MSDKRTTLASRVMLGIVAAWGFASVMALAFQCSLPNPWNNSGRCVNQVSEDHTAVTSESSCFLGRPPLSNWSLQYPHRRRSHHPPRCGFLEGPGQEEGRTCCGLVRSEDSVR